MPQGASTLEYLNGTLDKAVKQAARDTIALNVKKDGKSKVRYARIPTGATTCAFCTMLASRGWVYRTEETAGAIEKFHPFCVVGDTKVSGTGLNACLRRDYEGPLVSITTRSGRNISVTPEHPILTARGWVVAAEVEDSDALLCCADGNRKAASVPNIDDVHPSAKEIFEAAGLLYPSRMLSVPASAEYFDGEVGRSFDVYVVNVDGFLKCAGTSHVGKPPKHELFAGTGGFDSRSTLVGRRSGDFCADGDGSSTDCVMGSVGLCTPFLGSHFGRPYDACAGTAANGDARFFEPSANDAPADVVGERKLKDALSILVSFDDAGRHGDFLSSRLDAVARQYPVEVRGADASSFDHLLLLHAGKIQLDNVALVETRASFAGHVYNLSTAGGWFLANGIITHNCDCQIVPSWDANPHVDGYDPDALYDEYMAARKAVAARTPGFDRLKAEVKERLILAEMRKGKAAAAPSKPRHSVSNETLPDGHGGSSLGTAKCDVYTATDGKRFVFPQNLDVAKQDMTPERAIRLYDQVPDVVKKKMQDKIYFVDYKNPEDNYWRKHYKNFSGSYATDGGEMTFYAWTGHDDAYVVRTYCHEAGHYIDKTSSIASGYYSSKADWQNAITADYRHSGQSHPTIYAANSDREDFAESVALYATDGVQFRKAFPNRAALLDKLFK